MKPTLLLFSLLALWVNLSAADFYWIGGSGAWNDLNHWATSSGGDDLHFAIPSANDNVFFDDNSFPVSGATVDFPGSSARCRSFMVTANNNPRFSNQAIITMEVHGDFVLASNVDWRLAGQIVFFGATGNTTIDTGGQEIKAVSFVGSTNSFFLIRSNLASNNKININSGNVSFVPGTVMTTQRLSVARNARVDFSGLAEISSVNVDLSASPDLAFSLVSCDLEFTGRENTLSVDGTSEIRLGSIRAVRGNLSIGNTFSSDLETLTADSILFSGNGFFRTDLVTDYLELTTGGTYRFDPRIEVQVKEMIARGTCTDPITLMGDDDVYLGADAGAMLDLKHLYVENITVGGGEDWVATESYGTGNVTGWAFNNAENSNRYWVGGSGSWADAVHWAYTSGGTSGACPPTAANDAIFDALSFNSNNDTVFLPPGEWRTGTLDLREVNQPATFFDQAGQGLQVYGSCYLNEALDWNNSEISFRSFTTGREIQTHGRTENLNLTFDRETGGWELLDSLSFRDQMLLSSGRLATNGHPISGKRVASSGKSFFNLAGSNLYLTGAAGSTSSVVLFPTGTSMTSIGFNTAGVNIYAPDSTGRLSVLLRNHDAAPAILNNIHCAGRLSLRANNLRANMVSIGAAGAFYLNGQIDSFLLTPGNNYTFETDIIDGGLEVKYFEAMGTCLKPIGLSAPETVYTISAATEQEVTYADLMGINVSGPGWLAYASIDQGNNYGWVFSDTPAPRQLFWVGGGGSWFDPDHWSESAGGTGGACLPTRQDDVIFNDASFPTPGDTVSVALIAGNNNGAQANCRSLNSAALTRETSLQGYGIVIYGSVHLSEALRTSVGEFNLAATSGTNELLLPGLESTSILVSGGGLYTLLDSLTGVWRLSIDHGRLNTANHNIHAERININSPSQNNPFVAILDIGRADVYLMSSQGNLVMGRDPYVRLLSTGGTIFMSSTGNATVNSFSPGLNFKFREGLGRANLNGNSDLQLAETKFGSVTFGGDAYIGGQAGFDTLRLANGGNYGIEQSFRPLSIYHEFIAVGNVCNPVNISPRSNGGSGQINLAPGVALKMDYVRLDRVNAVGAEVYPAGSNSLNINDSSDGWSFVTNDGVNSLNRFFLGEDINYCTGPPPLLVPELPEGFLAEYSWQDGSNASDFQPPGPGTYKLRITFDGGQCAITDSLTITAPAFALNLPNEYEVCSADSLRLFLPDSGAEGYSWSVTEGAILEQNDSSALVAAPGRYFLRQELLACADSTEITIRPGAAVAATTAVAICPNTAYTTPLGTYTINQDTTITERYVAANGCDSLQTTAFTVFPTTPTDTLVELAAPGVFSTALADYFIGSDTTITEPYTTATGCESLRTYRISLPPETAVPTNTYYLPTAFSPNGDRTNDYFTIYGAPGAFVVERFEIFDRWGGMVFRSENFAPGDAATAWYGEAQPVGIYIVSLTLRWPDGSKETIRKAVHLMR